ncbi:MAG: aminotransferase class I/II-fold pyridoxal phosphate-dependent enzyme, partial [Herbinix sp.]|nr:aminotransferase class I/II-fold pyridoxal phosphate-dependent enzyme [Herbinix sp.]
QKGAYEALVGPQEFVYAMRDEFETRLNYMVKRVEDMEYISVVKPQGAFYLFVDISKTLDKAYKGQKIENVDNLAKILIENYQVAVISCDDFGFNDHIRLSYAISLEEIKKGLDRIEAFLKDLQ